MKIDELIEKLNGIRAQQGNCDVFASLGGRSSEFFVDGTQFIARDSVEHRPSPEQHAWLPSRAVLHLRLINGR